MDSEPVSDVMGSMARAHPGGQWAAAGPISGEARGHTAVVAAGFLRPPALFCSFSAPLHLRTSGLPETWADVAGAPSLAPRSNSEQGKRDA